MKHSEKRSTILMFVVFFLTSIVLWNIADLISKVEYQKKRSESYANSLTFHLVFSEIEELRGEGNQENANRYITEQLKRMIEEIESISDCNVSLSNVFLSVKSKQESVLCEVILKENTPLPYKIQEKMDDLNEILIGESLKKYSFQKNKRTFLGLADEDYSVNAVLKNYGINGQDDRVIILYHHLNEAQKKRLDDQLRDYYFNNFTDGITISLGGKEKSVLSDTYTKFEAYAASLENVEINIVPQREYVGELNYWYELYHSLFGTASLLFALINGIIVSGLWFQHHQREFIIRLTYGYSKGKLCALIAGKLGKISAFSILCSTVVWGIWLKVKGGHISWSMMILQSVTMLLGAFFVLFITILYPLRKTILLDPAEGLGKYYMR